MANTNGIHWEVTLTSHADKQRKTITFKIRAQLGLLEKEMELSGPIQRNWKNFSSLKRSKRIPENAFHCHIKSGKPTYVVCWKIEVFYVGTHENAPY